MLSQAEKLMAKAKVGDNCILYVTEFDRGLADAPHNLCKIINTKDDNTFQSACAAGIFWTLTSVEMDFS